MKRAMIIGKFNEVTRQIHNKMSEFCQVQICANDAEIVAGMMKLISPDLVLVSLVGDSSAHKDIFELLNQESVKATMIVIGSRENEMELQEEGYLSDKRFHFMCRPVKLEAVVERARSILKVEVDNSGKAVKTILVVDDNPTLLRTMQNMLSKKYKVTFASSGSQTIMSISKNKPDLILLDYDMPICDGKMTLQMLRAEKSTKDIPVIFLTGMSGPDYVGEVLALHPQGYLLKPPSEEKIFTALRNVLGDDDEEEQESGES